MINPILEYPKIGYYESEVLFNFVKMKKIIIGLAASLIILTGCFSSVGIDDESLIFEYIQFSEDKIDMYDQISRVLSGVDLYLVEEKKELYELLNDLLKLSVEASEETGATENMIKTGLAVYSVDNFEYPESLEVLKEETFIPETTPIEFFEYDLNGNEYNLKFKK